MTNSLTPLAINQRDQSLDALRGFALAGVLFVFCVSDVRHAENYTMSVADQIIDWFKYLMIEGRMYGMLIVIFGIGFSVQLEKAKKKGVSFVPVFSRRLLGLLIIGFIHAILFSTRDILMFYAIAGAMLLATHTLKNRQLFFVAFSLFLIALPVMNAFVKVPFNAFALKEPNELSAHIKYNWQFFKLYHQFYTIYIEMAIYFMIGFWIGRVGLLQKIKSDSKLRKRLLIISAISSVLFIYLNCFWLDSGFPRISKTNPWLRWSEFALLRVILEGCLFSCVTLYGCLIISLSVAGKGKKILNPLAAFGQIALSNYLIQSLVLVPYLLIFDKFGNLPPVNGFILFLVLFSLQLLFSTWWTSRFTLGPFEWLLRSFTYWKWQKIKRPAPVVINLNPSYLIKNN